MAAKDKKTQKGGVGSGALPGNRETDETRVGLATGSRAVLGGTNDDAVETTITPIVEDASTASHNASVLVTADGKKGPAADAA